MIFLSRDRARPASGSRQVPNLSVSTLSALILTGWAMSFSAQAQTASAPRPVIEELRQQERERALREQQERTVEDRLKPTIIDAQTLPDGESPCFRIDRLALTGEGAENFQWALGFADMAGTAADDWRGRCLGTKGMNVILARVQQAVIAKGFVTTRVLVGPQDLAGGTMTLTLIPSRIAAIRFKAAESGQPAPATTSLLGAIPARVGDLLNLRDVEQALENLKRLPTADADIQIEASTAPNAKPGDSDLVVAYTRKASALGPLAANNDTTIFAASLDSTRGTIAAVNGDLAVTTTGATQNSSGTMQAGGNVAITNGGFENSTGKVFGNALAIDTHGNALTNAQGTLAATTTVALNSGALTNDAGLIQSGGAMTVNTNGQALSNTNAAGYSGGQGGIASGGTLDLANGALDNSSGYVGSKGALTARTADVSNINGGIVFSESSVAVDTHGTTYDNTGGQTQAVGDVTVNAGTVQNAGGLVRSGATTTLNAGTIVNTGTQGTDQGIEGQNVALNVGKLNNTLGAVRSDVNTTITSGDRVDNANGLISAGDTLRIVDPNAARPADKNLGITNTRGALTANKALQLDAARFSADGTVASGQDLSIALTQDIVNNGEVSANGDLTYVTTGNLTNNGKLLAGGTLTAGGNVVENTTDAEMSGTNTVVQAGTLNNRGLIDSNGQTRIDAKIVNNLGTGRVYGDAVSIGAGTVNNDTEVANGATSSGTIAGRKRLDIGASVINNREHALIFSGGDMTIGGALNAGRRAVGQATELNNLSATIESLDNMSISAAQINNYDTHIQKGSPLTTVTGPVASIGIEGVGFFTLDQVITTTGSPIVYARNPDGSQGAILSYTGWGTWYTTTTVTEDTAVNADPARIVSGGDMTLAGSVHNKSSQIIAGGVVLTRQQ